eukprot:COSAG02_NODE_442_length_22243_cov_20.572887_10_plen_575_part_00
MPCVVAALALLLEPSLQQQLDGDASSTSCRHQLHQCKADNGVLESQNSVMGGLIRMSQRRNCFGPLKPDACPGPITIVRNVGEPPAVQCPYASSAGSEGSRDPRGGASSEYLGANTTCSGLLIGGSPDAAELDVLSLGPNARLNVVAQHESSFSLSDPDGAGFGMRRITNGEHGHTTAVPPTSNALLLERNVPLRLGATISASANTAMATASQSDDFSAIRAGDTVTIHIDGIAVERRVTMLNLDAEPAMMAVDSPFSSDADVADTTFAVRRPLVAFDDYHSIHIGGRQSPTQVHIESSHDSAELVVEANDSPIDQPDSTGQKGEAKISILSNSVSTALIGTGTGEARLKLMNTESRKGHMLTQFTDSNAGNTFVHFRTAPGLDSVYCDAGSTMVQGAGFSNIVGGDYIMVQVDGVEVSRKVSHCCSPTGALTVEAPFSEAVSIQSSPYTVMKPAVEMRGESIELTSPHVRLSGDVTVSKIFAATTQTVDAAAQIAIETSHLIIRAVIGVQPNMLTMISREDGGQREAGTMLFVENNDDDDAGGPTFTACPAQSRCIYVYDGSVFQIYGQIDMY